MTTISTVALSAEEARRLTDEVRADAATLWSKLLRLYEGGAHRALGYSAWGTYFESEFGQSGTRGYQLLEAARIHAVVVDLTAVESLTERQLRELGPLRDNPDAVGTVINQARAAYGDTPTAEQLRTKVRTFLAPAEPGAADSPITNTVHGLITKTDSAAAAMDVTPGVTEEPGVGPAPPVGVAPLVAEPVSQQRQLLDDFLLALADAPRFGLLRYGAQRLKRELSLEAIGHDELARLRAGITAVGAWLAAWEQALGLSSSSTPTREPKRSKA